MTPRAIYLTREGAMHDTSGCLTHKRRRLARHLVQTCVTNVWFRKAHGYIAMKM